MIMALNEVVMKPSIKTISSMSNPTIRRLSIGRFFSYKDKRVIPEIPMRTRFIKPIERVARNGVRRNLYHRSEKISPNEYSRYSNTFLIIELL